MKFCFILAIVGILWVACAHTPAQKTEKDMAELQIRLQQEITAAHAEVGLALQDLASGHQILINAKQLMHAASTMKVPVMIEVFKQAEQGKFSLDDSLVVQNEFHSIVDTSLYSLSAEDDSDQEIYRLIGKKSTVRELIFKMITVSSNLATNQLVELVGAKNIRTTLSELGVHNMQVLRGVEDGKAHRQGLNNVTDAYDLMLVMAAIAEGKVGSQAACREMIRILSAQTFRSAIPTGLPAGVQVVNKTGSIPGVVNHDAAIVFPPGQPPYVLVVLTRGITEDKKAKALIAKLSQIIYQEIVGG